MSSATEVREQLVKQDAHFRALHQKHGEYENRLEELRAAKYLSDEEKLEEVRLKKLKLALKDQMEQLVRARCG